MNTNTKEYEVSILKKIEENITETMTKKAAIHNNKEASPEGVDKELAIALLDRRVGALKLVKSEFIRQNEKNHHTNLEYKMTEDEEVKVLLKMAEDHKANIEGYDKAGNTEMLNKEKGELAVVEEFTPAQPTEEEITEYVNTLIDKLISEKGADYKLQQRDMGVLMKGAKEKYPNINGNIVKSALAARMS
jgi:uncharacterized protein YqeY